LARLQRMTSLRAEPMAVCARRFLQLGSGKAV
jgi:hypothetical protein